MDKSNKQASENNLENIIVTNSEMSKVNSIVGRTLNGNKNKMEQTQQNKETKNTTPREIKVMADTGVQDTDSAILEKMESLWISLPKEVVKYRSIEDNMISVTLGNEYMFQLDQRNVSLEQNNISFLMGTLSNRTLDEIKGVITSLPQKASGSKPIPSYFLDDEKTEKQQMDFNRNRTMNWSKHTNFEPDKRFVVLPSRQLVDELDYKYLGSMKSLIQYLMNCYPDGMVQEWSTKHGKFQLLPMEHFHIKWNDFRLTYQNTNANIATSALAALGNQQMTKKQYMRLISLMTSMSMMSEVDKIQQPFYLISKFLTTAEKLATSYSWLINKVNFSGSDFKNLFKKTYHIVFYWSGIEKPTKHDYLVNVPFNMEAAVVTAINGIPFMEGNIEYFTEPEEVFIKGVLLKAYKEQRLTFKAFEDAIFPSVDKQVEMFKKGQFHKMWTAITPFALTNTKPKILKISQQKHVDRGDSNYQIFEQGAARHVNNHEHHVEFWKGERMSIQATVELLCDHWSCSRRNNVNYDVALYKSLDWLTAPKFQVLNPAGVAYFFSSVSRFAFVNTYHPGMSLNYKLWAGQFENAEILSMMEAYNTRKGLRWLLNNRDVRVKAFFSDISLHQADVNYMYSKITGCEISHDQDKSTADYALALLMKFGSKEEVFTEILPTVTGRVNNKKKSKVEEDEEIEKQVLIRKLAYYNISADSTWTLESLQHCEANQISTIRAQSKSASTVDFEDAQGEFFTDDEGIELVANQSKDPVPSTSKMVDQEEPKNDLFKNKGKEPILNKPAINIETPPKENETLGFFGKFKSFLGKPIVYAKDMFSNVNTIKESLVTMEERIREFTDSPLPKAGVIQESYALIGKTINKMVRKMLEKLFRLLNIELAFESVDTVKIVFYYLIWMNTECKSLKLVLLVDMMISLGVFDAIIDLYNHFKKHIPTELATTTKITKDCDCWLCSVFGFEHKIEVTTKISDAINQVKGKISTITEKVDKKKESLPPKPVVLDEEESWFFRLLHQIGDGVPFALGALATGMLASYGFKTIMQPSKIGEQIVKAFKNIHFISLGILALPKIFVYFMSVVHWVQDYVKAIFIKKHKTKYQKIKSIENWVERTRVYHTGVTETVLANSVVACTTLVNEYLMGLDLSKDFSMLDPSLRIECNKRLVDLSALYTKALTFAKIQSGADEPFHIQFSGEPGCGKADLMALVHRNLCPAMGLNESFYPFNETLAHMDAYAGQDSAIVDEANAANDIETEKVMRWLMLLSGTPFLAQMADLSEKGRMVDFKLILSATNTPFPNINNINCMQALYRRRLWIKVRVKEHLRKKHTGAEILIDEDACSKAGVDRTRCEHLEFSLGDNSNKAACFDDPFEIDQLIEYLILAAKRHSLIEEDRAIERNQSQRREIINQYEELHKFLVSSENELEKTQAFAYLKEYFANAKSFEEQRQRGKIINTFGPINVTYGDTANIHLEWKDGVWKSVPKISTLPSMRGPVDLDNLDFEVGKDGFVVWTVKNEPQSISVTRLGSYAWWIDMIRVEGRAETANYRKSLQKLQEEHRLYSKIIREQNFIVEQQKTWFGRVKSMFTSCFDWIRKTLSLAVQTAISAVIAFGIVVGCCSLLGSMFGKKETTYIGNRPAIKTVTSVSSNYFDHNITLAQKHMYVITATERITGKTYQQNMVGLQGNYFLASKHMFDGKDYEDTVNIYDPIIKTENKYELNFKKHVKFIDGADAAIIYFPGFRSVSHCKHQFVVEADLAEEMLAFNNFEGYLVALDPSRPNLTVTERLGLSRHNWDGNVMRDGKQYYLPSNRTVMARKNIVCGNSGGILVHSNTKVARPFLGLAMADKANRNESYFTVLTQEMIDNTIKQFNLPQTTFLVLNRMEKGFDKTQVSALTQISDMPSVAKMVPQINVNTKSEIYKTPLYPLGDVDCQPAILSPNDERCIGKEQHPYKQSLNKYVFSNNIFLTSAELKAIGEYLEDAYMSVESMSEVVIWSTKNAITGTWQPGSTPMNLSSSPGLPYKLQTTLPGKSQWISYDEENGSYRIANSVFEDVDEYIDNIRKGIINQHPKMEFLKDEVVPNSKIENPKTRTVATGNMVHTIVYRRMFGDMMRILKMNNHGSFFCAVGINFESDDWDSIVVKRLKGNSLQNLNNVLAIDVSKWDSVPTLSLATTVAQAKVNVLKRAYKARNQPFPDWVEDTALGLAVDFVDTNVVFNDFVYHKAKGMLSGHPGTLLENSDMHAGILYVLFRRLVVKKRRSDLCNMQAFKEHIRFVNAADDILIVFTNFILGIFTFQEFIDEYGLLGIKITGADKSDNIELTNLSNADFLKMKFRYDGVFWKPYPRDTIITQLLNWQRKTNGYHEQFYINLLAAFRFKYWHGEELYEKLREEVNTVLFGKRLNTFDISYTDMEKLMEREIKYERFNQQILDRDRLNPKSILNQEAFGDAMSEILSDSLEV